MNAMIQRVGLSALIVGLSLSLAGAPAMAAKVRGKSATGGGGTGGGGGGSKITLTTVTVPLAGGYYGIGGSGSTVATGSVTMTFDATQTSRSMSLSASNVHLPDGTILHCVITDNGLTQPTLYYPVDVPQLIANLPLSAGHASITGSTANGDNVPLFGTIGSITVRAVDPVTGHDLGLVLSGFYNLGLKKGGGVGGGNL